MEVVVRSAASTAPKQLGFGSGYAIPGIVIPGRITGRFSRLRENNPCLSHSKNRGKLPNIHQKPKADGDLTSQKKLFRSLNYS